MKVEMNSFTKVCMDLSNNLRSLRFTKAASQSPAQTPSPKTSISLPVMTSTGHKRLHTDGRTRDQQEVKSVVHSPISQPPSPRPRTRLTHKKPAPPVPLIADSTRRDASTTRAQKSFEHVPKSSTINYETRSKLDVLTTQKSLNNLKVHAGSKNTGNDPQRNLSSNTDRCLKSSSCSVVLSEAQPRKTMHPPSAPVYRKFQDTLSLVPKPSTPQPAQRFSSRTHFSPTMAHRMASLARNYHGNSEKSNIVILPDLPARSTQSNCTSPVLVHRGTSVAAIKERLANQGLRVHLCQPAVRQQRTRYRDHIRRWQRGHPASIQSMWFNDKLMLQVFNHLPGRSLLASCTVCRDWNRLLSRVGFFGRIRLRLDVQQLVRRCNAEQHASNDEDLSNGYSLTNCLQVRLESGIKRGIGTLVLQMLSEHHSASLLKALDQVSALTSPVHSLSEPETVAPQQTGATSPSLNGSNSISHMQGLTASTIQIKGTKIKSLPRAASNELASVQGVDFQHLCLRWSTISDDSFERLLKLLPQLNRLDLICCNELSEYIFWTALRPKITQLTLFDCLNVADESMAAVSEVLQDLSSLTLQTFHVSAGALQFFKAGSHPNLRTIRLVQCIDLTNQSISSLSGALANLEGFSVSGCNSLTDEGIMTICDSLRSPLWLDLSGCTKITDLVLQAISDKLRSLRRLILDRCTAITDLGIGRLSVMPKLQVLSVRWCSNLTDGTISFLVQMVKLREANLAGCKRITEEGLCRLVHRSSGLRQLDVANCPAATRRVRLYLTNHLPHCHVWS